MLKFHRAMRAALSCFALVLLAACSSPPSQRTAAPDAQLTAAIADPLRAAPNRARDGARHPYETLRAFGLQPDWTVVEIAPGGGWYTEILAPYLRTQGHYVAALYVEDAASPDQTQAQIAQARERFEAKFGRNPARYGQIVVGTLRNQGLTGAGAPASADAVLTFRNIHNWIEGGHFDAALRSFFDVLKPGGVLGVEEHRAPAGTSLDRIIATGYVPEDYVIEHAKLAGFALVSRSEANANALDTKNHPNGVWSLPPTLRGGAVDRDRFLAIGESDRMTLTFVKPKR
jgi:predicted methyltransferase